MKKRGLGVESKEFFSILTAIATLEQEKLYNSLSCLGVELGLCSGRLEIIELHSLEERKLVNNQKERFYKLLGSRSTELKEEYLKQNPQFSNTKVPGPYLKENGELIIPQHCNARYCYWLRDTDFSWKHLERSQSIHEILIGLNAPGSIIEKYIGVKAKTHD